jgi:acyl transferase domain-containing protein
MLSISNVDDTTLKKILVENKNISVAAHNAPNTYVLSGGEKDVQQLRAALDKNKMGVEPSIRAVILHVNRAFHSPFMSEAAEVLEKFLLDVNINPPKIPVTSNVTGTWMGEEMLETKYWGDHMRGTVRFVENVKCLAQWLPTSVIEVGPGSTLCKLMARCYTHEQQQKKKKIEKEEDGGENDKDEATTLPQLVPSMRHPKATDVTDSHVFQTMLGILWCNGVSCDWNKYHRTRAIGNGSAVPSKKKKVPLPG